MTPQEFKAARKQLGLSIEQMSEALRMGVNGGRTIRRWEAGDIPVTGPAQVAVEYMLGDVNNV